MKDELKTTNSPTSTAASDVVGKADDRIGQNCHGTRNRDRIQGENSALKKICPDPWWCRDFPHLGDATSNMPAYRRV